MYNGITLISGQLLTKEPTMASQRHTLGDDQNGPISMLTKSRLVISTSQVSNQSNIVVQLFFSAGDLHTLSGSQGCFLSMFRVIPYEEETSKLKRRRSVVNVALGAAATIGMMDGVSKKKKAESFGYLL